MNNKKIAIEMELELARAKMFKKNRNMYDWLDDRYNHINRIDDVLEVWREKLSIIR